MHAVTSSHSLTNLREFCQKKLIWGKIKVSLNLLLVVIEICIEYKKTLMFSFAKSLRDQELASTHLGQLLRANFKHQCETG